MRRTTLTLIALVLAGTVSLAKDGQGKNAADAQMKKIVAPLVKQLDDPSFDVREKATLALIQLGPKAEPALREFMPALSLEARSRLRQVFLHYREIERREALGAPSNGEWPMLKRSPGREASDGLGGIRKKPGFRWTVDLPFAVGRPFFDSPLFSVGNQLIVVGRGGQVASVSADKGKLQWLAKTGEKVYAAPVMAGGTIYVPGDDLTALDARNGKIIWRWKTDYGCTASPLAFGNRIYAIDKGEKIAALDPATGKETWKMRLPVTTSAPVAVGDLIVVGTERGLVAFSASDKITRWRFRSLTPIMSAPAVLPDRIVVGDEKGDVYGVSLDHGRQIWRRSIPEGRLWETPVVYGDVVLFATTGATFRAIRAADGMDLWTRFVGMLKVSSPSVCGGVAYFTAGPRVHAMDCATGDDLWRRVLVSTWSSPILIKKRLYIVSQDGLLACLE